VEHNSETGGTCNGEDDDVLTPSSGRGTIAGGGHDDGEDSSFSSDNSSSGSSVHSQRSLRKPKKAKRIKKRADRGKTPEQQQWETMRGIVTPETSTEISKRKKRIKIDTPENLNSEDKIWRES